MDVLRSKKILVLLLGYAVIITLIRLTLPNLSTIYSAIWLMIGGIYFKVVLLSRPWGALTLNERRTRRTIFTLLVAGSSAFTLGIIVYFIGLGLYTKSFLETITIVTVAYYIYEKSEFYLDIYLIDGGIL